jgi:hypothetical protein
MLRRRRRRDLNVLGWIQDIYG